MHARDLCRQSGGSALTYRVDSGVPYAGWHVQYVRRWSSGTEGIHWTLLFKKGHTPLFYKALFYKAVWLCFPGREAEA